MIKGVNVTFPFRTLGFNSDNRQQFIHLEPFRWCPQKYSHAMRQGVGWDRYGTPQATFPRARADTGPVRKPRKPDSSARTNLQDRPRSGDRSKR